MLTNARSISSKISELKATAYDLNPDIIAITESWANSSICNTQLAIPGYKLMCRKDRIDTSNGRGGGILVYAKTNSICHEIATPTDMVQSAAMQIRLTDHSLNFFAVYRSPNSTVENNNRLNDFIRSIPEHSIIVGDFNFPSIDWELMSGNSQARDFLDAIEEKFLTQHVDFPTHDGGNLLDLVLSNIPQRIISVSDCGKLANSDHSIIMTEIEATLTTHTPNHSIWNFKHARFEEMRDILRNIQWREILINDIETDWNVFKSTLTAICNQYIPMKTIKEIKQPPWLKRETLRLVRQKRTSWKIFKNTGDVADLQHFRTLQKKVKKAIRNAKHRYETQISKYAKTNPKLFYSYLGKRKQNKVGVGPLHRGSGELSHDNNEMAELFNEHYIKVFTTEDPNLPTSPPSSQCPIMPDINFYPYRVSEVLRRLKNSSSPGPDEISQRVLKEMADEVSLPLSLLFNKSVKTSILPTDWKKLM